MYIKSSKSGTYAKILPEIGGILAELVFNNESVIVCPIQPDDYLKSYPSAFLFPFPSRIEDGKYSFEGKNYQLPINEPARGNAIHGFVAGKEFTIKEVTECSVSLIYFYKGDIEGYPFPFNFEVTYQFIEEVTTLLSITYKATNTGKTTMPCALGWHPYFKLGDSVDELSIKIPATQAIFLNERMLPIGKENVASARIIKLKDKTLDNGFYVSEENNFCQTELISNDKKLIIWQEKNNFKYLVIYTPKDRKSIAIEPLTSNINAFNNQEDLIVLKPNESVSGEIKIWLEVN